MMKSLKNGSKSIRLDIGCGPHKKEGFIGIDIKKIDGVNFVVDLERKKLPFKKNTVQEIYSSHFLEHTNRPEEILKEFNRVLKNYGKLTIIVPHYTNPYSYHFTHKTFWSSYSFNQEYIDYYLDTNFILSKKEIRIAIFPILNPFLNKLVNLNLSFYERFLSTFIKAWDVKFELKKIENRSEKESI